MKYWLAFIRKKCIFYHIETNLRTKSCLQANRNRQWRLSLYYFLTLFSDGHIHNGWHHAMKLSLAEITAFTCCRNRLQEIMTRVLERLAIASTTATLRAQRFCVDVYWSPSKPVPIRSLWDRSTSGELEGHKLVMKIFDISYCVV